MKRGLFLCLALSGCVTAATKDQIAAGCTSKDLAFLEGMKFAGPISPVDPASAKGQGIAAQKLELEIRRGLALEPTKKPATTG